MTSCDLLERHYVSKQPAASIFTPLHPYRRRNPLLRNVVTRLPNNTVSHPWGYTIHSHLRHNLKYDRSFYYLAPWLERLKCFRNWTWNTKYDIHWRRVGMNWQSVIGFFKTRGSYYALLERMFLLFEKTVFIVKDPTHSVIIIITSINC